MNLTESDDIRLRENIDSIKAWLFRWAKRKRWPLDKTIIAEMDDDFFSLRITFFDDYVDLYVRHGGEGSTITSPVFRYMVCRSWRKIKKAVRKAGRDWRKELREDKAGSKKYIYNFKA